MPKQEEYIGVPFAASHVSINTMSDAVPCLLHCVQALTQGMPALGGYRREQSVFVPKEHTEEMLSSEEGLAWKASLGYLGKVYS